MNIFKKSTLWIVWISLGAAFATTAQAQNSVPATSFEELQSTGKLKEGQSVEIIDDKGKKIRAKITDITSNEIAVKIRKPFFTSERRTLPESAVKEIRRRKSENTLRSMLFGFGVTTAIGAGIGAAVYDPEIGWSKPAFTGFLAGVLAPVGYGIGNAIVGKEKVFVRPGSSSRGLKISPVVSKSKTGVKVAWSF